MPSDNRSQRTTLPRTQLYIPPTTEVAAEKKVRRSPLPWLVGGGCLFCALLYCGGFAGVAWWMWSSRPASQPAVTQQNTSKSGQEKTLPTADELETQIAGFSMREVRQTLGNPDQVVQDAHVGASEPNDDCWSYRERTRNPRTGKPDAFTCVWFRDGRVIHVSGFTSKEP